VVSVLSTNLANVRQRIEAAADGAGRDPGEVKLVAVTKTHPSALILEAIGAGQTVFGENKVQEAGSKIADVGPAEWHLIGHLQSNKARKAVQLFDVIQSLDSIELAERLERICEEENGGTLSVLVQVDLAGEEARSGIAERDLSSLVDYLKTCKYLKFNGLMVLPPYFDDPERTRPYFQRLRALRNEVSPGGELSMGMSHDFEVAIEEGATIVRVGTAIFGEREKR
jgi:PLP dependent protein